MSTRLPGRRGRRSAVCPTWNAILRSLFQEAEKLSQLCSGIGANRGRAPALSTSRSGSASSMSRSSAGPSVASKARVNTWPGPVTSRLAPSSRSRFRPTAQTRRPAAASATTAARPTPEPPPITIAVPACFVILGSSTRTTFQAPKRMRPREFPASFLADLWPCLLVITWPFGGTRTMAGRYGMSFAAKMIQEGKYAEAIEEATRAVARDDEDPAPLVERANAYALLERYPEAVKDLEAAIALDETAGVLESDVVDDAYFSALLGAAKLEAQSSLDAATGTLARYATILPAGRHLADAAAWPDRLRT